MSTDALNSLRNAVEILVDLLLLPGQLILLQLTNGAPEFFHQAGASADNHGLRLAIAALFWLVVILLLRKALEFVNNLCIRLLRYKEAIVFRVSMEWRFSRQRLERIFGILGGSYSEPVVEPPKVEFARVDIDVLECIASHGPGLALSAPDLAENLGLRPAEIQPRLDKLARFSLVESIIGATDGFENFRLTPSGEAYASMLQRKPVEPAQPEPEPRDNSKEFIPDGIHLGG